MEASKLKEILDQHRLWLNGKGGKCANLKRANLQGANLQGANLYGADLEGAELWSANLYGADLCGANLTAANLTAANLYGADLGGANLTGADLTGVDLRYANLTGADLTGVDLRYANLTGAILPDISWIIPGCLVQLNGTKCDFYLKKEDKYENFVQDSFGFFIQNNVAEETFDMLAGDRIIRNITRLGKIFWIEASCGSYYLIVLFGHDRIKQWTKNTYLFIWLWLYHLQGLLP